MTIEDRVVRRALNEGATLEGLQDAINRRLTLDVIDEHHNRRFPARAGVSCTRCSARLEPELFHFCTTEAP